MLQRKCKVADIRVMFPIKSGIKDSLNSSLNLSSLCATGTNYLQNTLRARHNADTSNHEPFLRSFFTSQRLTPSHPLLLRQAVNSVPAVPSVAV